MIRKADIQDLTQVQELYEMLFSSMADLEPNYMKEAKQDESFIRSVILGENDFSIFVAEKEGQIQGFAIAQLQNSPPYNCFVQQRCVYLMDLVVNPRIQGKGFGTKLIERVKEWGQENKVDYFELNVLSTNQKAIELYKRMGLEPFSHSMRMRLNRAD
ncbi:GNAT family N-acetyltransferase [Myroides sp. DF42-4-2]|uniref:GNAT family N-acetyltransferase n=1 Tax=Myroides sp. DF42-4-2 TaxID=2746726 RepID=UPI00257822C2|nr:GNAT family N-acetyltransferase [Myroides sp. DF42-4-2]MDM1407426.1 GNAT family N-acetyltransferase [Myroides sp. DF42-4-2]